MSGGTPMFSTSHEPVGFQKPTDGGATTPPSIKSGQPPKPPTKPPQVVFPISGPIPVFRKYHGNASPPEPAYSLMSITFGPKTAPRGVVKSAPSRVVR